MNVIQSNICYLSEHLCNNDIDNNYLIYIAMQENISIN